MKTIKLFAVLTFVVVLFYGFSGASIVGNLYTATYTSVYRDTITIAGSTDQTSDWFTNSKSYDEVYALVYNGAYWVELPIDMPCAEISKFLVQFEASDSTISIAGYIGTKTVTLPLKIYTGTAPVYYVDMGYTAKALLKQTGGVFYVQFYGRKD